jgi:hypothetical protein
VPWNDATFNSKNHSAGKANQAFEFEPSTPAQSRSPIAMAVWGKALAPAGYQSSLTISQITFLRYPLRDQPCYMAIFLLRPVTRSILHGPVEGSFTHTETAMSNICDQRSIWMSYSSASLLNASTGAWFSRCAKYARGHSENHILG